jgi:mRNA interferase MazF
VNVGDIHWIDLPPTNGREQAGRRPAVMVQEEEFAGSLPLALAIPLTAAVSTVRFPGTVLLQPTTENGLREASVALVFQIRAIDRRRIRERIGAVNAEDLEKIFTVLDRILGRHSL